MGLTAGELIDCVKIVLSLAQDSIRQLEAAERQKSSNWTRIILDQLAKKGRAQAYHAYPDRTDGFDRGEWLYDACWIDYGGYPTELPPPKKRRFRSLILAAECEWGRSDGDFLDDFEKLLQARAKLRVMIFGGKDRSIFKDRCDFARHIIEGYEDAGSDAFLMVWISDNSAQDFQCEVIQNYKRSKP